MENKKLSLCMIVKNEEKVIERCLKSIDGIFDEIIIVDTGSTDETKNKAKKLGALVFDYAWNDDFASARNYSLSLAKSDYVMWLDADDVVSNVENEKLKKLKTSLDGSIDVYMLKYNIAFDEDDNPTFNYYRERIFKNDERFRFVGVVHEVVCPSGNIKYLDISINHMKEKSCDAYSTRNLDIYLKVAKVKEFSPREQYYYARELFYNKKIKKSIKEVNKFLSMQGGWVEDYYGAIEIKARCLIELHETQKAKKTIFQSFETFTPRNVLLCLLGDCFLIENNYLSAVCWYEFALNLKNNQLNGFVQADYNLKYPALQLSYCYFMLKNNFKAEYYNNMVLSNYPKNINANTNKKYFDSIKKISHKS